MELTKKDYKYINNTNDGSRLLGLADGQLSAIQKMSGVSGYTNSARSVIGGTLSTLNNSAPLSAMQKLNAQYGGSGQYNQSVVDSITPNAINYSDDPYTKNPNLKPTSNSIVPTNTTKSGVNMLLVQGGLSAVPEFGQHIYDSWTNYDSQEDLRARYKDASAYAGGIGYNVLTHTGEEREDNTFGNILGSTASGASVGSMFGPWGAVIGGVVGLAGSGIGSIFSHNKQKEQERIMAYKINNINNDRTGNALTKSLRLSYAKEHGDSGQQYLYGAKDGMLPVDNINSSGLFMMNDKNTDLLFKAKNGKLPKYTDGSPAVDSKTGLTKKNYLLDTAYGEIYGKANALGQPGEIITDTKTGATNEIGSGLPRHSGDIIPIFADKYTAILTDNWIDPVTKKTYAQAAKDGDDTIPNLIDRMAMYVKPSKQTKTAKDGKLPKFAEGGWANAITSGLGGIAALGLYITAAKNKPYRPNTYSENPYEIDALSTLAGLRVNPYPIMQELRNAESRTNRIIDRSGGLSTAQRGLSRLSALYGTQNNIANTLAGIQQQNNAYKANYAQAAINAGNASAQRRMAANQWDLDYFSKAHAARLGGMQTGIQNMLAQAQNWYRNDFKRRQFNNTMALYKLEQANTAAANEAMRQYNQLLIDMLKQLYMSEDWWRLYGKQKGWLS